MPINQKCGRMNRCGRRIDLKRRMDFLLLVCPLLAFSVFTLLTFSPLSLALPQPPLFFGLLCLSVCLQIPAHAAFLSSFHPSLAVMRFHSGFSFWYSHISLSLTSLFRLFASFPSATWHCPPIFHSSSCRFYGAPISVFFFNHLFFGLISSNICLYPHSILPPVSLSVLSPIL